MAKHHLFSRGGLLCGSASLYLPWGALRLAPVAFPLALLLKGLAPLEAHGPPCKTVPAARAAGAINRRSSRFHQDAPAAGDRISCGSSALARCHRHRLLTMVPHHHPTLPVTGSIIHTRCGRPRSNLLPTPHSASLCLLP